MRESTSKLEAWHRTKVGHTVFGTIELVLAYLIGSRAIDTGSWWEYFLTVFFLLGVAQNFTRLIGLVFKGNGKS
ncbi:MAG TPA: hypothetical protein VLG25_03000 [Patescibacteria group bacterium]|nr:hypothetical protein [Patescibacteria group bacterium]